MEEKIRELYILIERHASRRNWENALRALEFIYNQMTTSARNVSDQSRNLNELLHCLQVCLLIIDLHIEMSSDDEEAMIVATLMHIYPENFQVDNLENCIVDEMGYSHRTYEVLEPLIAERDMTEEERLVYYSRIQENPLSLIAALADRGNVLQHIDAFSTWDAHQIIGETKAYVFPMCIYGKENYVRIAHSITILMEKMRNLIEVAEILLRRYEVRESELIQDIQDLREQNATMRGIIEEYQRPSRI